MVIAPAETCMLLLEEDRPRYGLAFLLILVMTIFVPIGIQYHNYGRNLYRPEAIAALFLILLLTLVLFFVLESLLLLLLSVPFKLNKLMASIMYCLCPLILSIWGMYIINYSASGNLSFLTIVLNGFAAEEDRFIEIVPWIIGVGGLITMYIYYSCLKAFSNMLAINAAVVTLVSLIPLYAALVGAVFAANIIYPNTIDLFLQMIHAPTSVLG